ncbi:sporulation protein YqfC [Gottfriedia luciferensis]|uniref:Sporulation protein YqfC n=2 Tax=Bacillales TaxID=1385 RepID=A0ABX2ZNU3_9BACI|nr:sporulation protein YqfC [Gottfriedia luciferensis]
MLKRLAHNLKTWMSSKMDLPPDVLLELPRITMLGQLHIYIENHRGLLVYSDNELRLLMKQGQLLIKGKDFILKTMLPEEILLEGEIEHVYFINE